MQVSNRTLALVAVAGLALAGYAGAASTGLLPEGIDAGLGTEARNARLAQAQARCQAVLDEGKDPPEVCERILAGELPPMGALRARCAAAANPDGEKPAACGKADGRRHGKERPHLPAFEMSEGVVSGKWVSFTVDPEAAALVDYTSKGPFADAVIFDRVALTPVTDVDGMRVRGPLWFAKDGDVQAAAFNAPNALLVVRNTGSEPATVSFDIADGIAAEVTDGGVKLTREGHSALLKTHGDATLALADGVVTATLPQDSAVGFGIEGFPRLTHWELQMLRHLAGDGAQREPAAGEPEAAPAAEAGA